MSFIQITNLTFSYDSNYDLIFDHVSFKMDTDWKLGLTGRNGRGKTTFLKLLMGEHEYRGSIASQVSFDYFPYPVADISSNTIDIVEEIYPDYEYWRLEREIHKLQLEDGVLFRPFETLSHGEQTKVLLAVLFLKEGNFLLIDEPTNHLDAEARYVVGEYLNSKKGFILVSHDRAFLDSCVDHILAINKNNIEVQRGNFSTWYDNKKRQDTFELGENERLKKDIKHLTVASRRTKQWGDKAEATKIGNKSHVYEKCIDTRAYIGEKSRRMQQRRKNLEHRQERAIEEKAGLLKNIEQTDVLKMIPAAYHTQKLLQAEDISVSYGDKRVCGHISFTIRQGDRIALHGKNGCGKSSILKLIMGEKIDYRGRLEVGSSLSISYVSQDTAFLRGSLSDYAYRCGIEESLFKAILRKLNFSRGQFEKSMEYFSEGQKKKVLLARSLSEKAHLYIWDEPLNFIDVFSRIQIEELLLIYCPTLLFVEHDQVFCKKIATETVEL